MRRRGSAAAWEAPRFFSNAAIAAAIAERADVLEAVAADLYGPGTLVREGLLPAELVAQNPAWLRPLVGHTPPGVHSLDD
ncbi:MAG: circularly permuted type 2 ATP-grasp protein, partial [Pseudomonadota bacterium]